MVIGIAQRVEPDKEGEGEQECWNAKGPDSHDVKATPALPADGHCPRHADPPLEADCLRSRQTLASKWLTQGKLLPVRPLQRIASDIALALACGDKGFSDSGE
ncbi:hypothetical protein [Novosphingobium cyanobacteriorum]|uniref:hypothetical protein n=1 Tax=Novosphingobium cyanobacteriorum TaxID=3024215 RepID=UPI0023F6D24E|nr:hypothetical protein [Novosphingobium cyanobacteriorum]